VVVARCALASAAARVVYAILFVLYSQLATCNEFLLVTGADTNRATTASGATSLHRAAYMGHTSVTRLLCALVLHPMLPGVQALLLS